MNKIWKQIGKWGAALACGVIVFGCGGGGGSSSGNGTLQVRMADAPNPEITAVNVTIDRVEANVNGEWVTITPAVATFNLYDLRTDDTILGEASLPAGHYTQVRLFPSAATLTDIDGNTHDVDIPSGAQTGVKVLVDHDINSGEVTTILLDFDVAKSFNQQGNGQWSMKPVVRGVVKVLSGTISGTVSNGSAGISGAVVTATPTGGTPSVDDPATISTEDGTFKIWAVMPGTYTVTVKFTPEGGTEQTATVNDVVVTANADTSVGTVTLAGP